MKASHTVAGGIVGNCVIVLSLLGTPRFASDIANANAKAARIATEAELNLPESLTFGSSNLLFIATFKDGKIHCLDLTTGLMSDLQPRGLGWGVGDIVMGRSGKLIAANPFQCQVVQIDVDDGAVETIIGKRTNTMGTSGCGSDGDNGPAVKAALEPDFITQDSDGNLFIIDGEPRAKVRRVDDKSGIITTVVPQSQLQSALTVAVDEKRTLFISQAGKDAGHRGVLSMEISSGLLSVLKSSSFRGNKDIWDKSMERRRIFSDPLGNLYLLSESRVFYIDFAKHLVSVVAGIKTKGFSGDGGPATEAQLYWPTSLVLDSAGNIYIADSENQRIRRIDAKTHIITTVAGNGGPPHIPGSIELSQ